MAREFVASDDFNRSTGIGANWSQVCTTRGNVVITGDIRVWGEFSAAGNDHPTAKWVGAGTFTDDQYSSAVIPDSTPTGSTYRVGVIVRASSGTNATRDYYEVYIYQPSTRFTHLVKYVDGTPTTLYSSDSPTWADGDSIELEVQGNTLTVCKNGTPLGGGFTYTDSSSPLTTGLPGISVTNQMYIDSWEGGNLGGGATLTSDSGTYSITGQSAGLFVARILTAEQGTYTFTGQSATLLKETPGVYTLPADYGQYTWTGENAQADYAMNAEYGVYSLTGQEVIFSRTYPQTYILSAFPGSYTLVGKRTVLRWSNEPLVIVTKQDMSLTLSIGLL